MNQNGSIYSRICVFVSHVSEETSLSLYYVESPTRSGERPTFTSLHNA